MNNAIDFLNSNSGALMVVFTGVVTISTAAYALLTRKLVQETILLREVETEPSLSVYITPSERYIDINELVIQNHGRGTALDIRWEVEPPPESLKDHGVKLDSLALLKGLAQLAPGQQLRTFFGASIELLKPPVCPDVIITAQYRSISGKAFCSKFVLSPEQFRGLTKVGSEADDQMARSLEKLQKAVSGAFSLDHLHVATATEEELCQKRREYVEQMQKGSKQE